MIKCAAFTLSFAVLVLSLGQTTVHANEAAMQQALATLDAQLPGKLINNPYDIQWRTEGSDKREQIVESVGVPGGMAYRVTVKKTKRNAWDTAIRIPMTTSVEKDDVILVSFWARTEKPQKGRDTGDIRIALQRNVEPYDSVIEKSFNPGAEWKLYSVSGTASRDYSADKTNINFNLAKAKQTLEFGPFYVMSLGAGADASQYMTE